MTAVSGAGDGAGAAAFHPEPSNPVKRRGGRTKDDVDDDDAVSVTVVRRKVPVENPILGSGWTACIDDASGNTYYYQSGTGKVQWEMPAEAEARPAKLDRKITFMPEGWSKLFTDEGKGYYVNPIGTSQWEKPPNNLN